MLKENQVVFSSYPAMDMQLFLSITLWLLIGSSTAYLANQRGRDPWVWFMIGMLLGILGLLLLLLLPTANKETPPSIVEEEGEFPLVETENVPSPQALDLWYYYDLHQEQQGPVTLDILKTLFKQNEINRETFLWCEGMPDWKKLGALTELYAKLEAQ